MKKILSLLLVLAVLLGLAGCLPSQVPETTAEPTTQTTAAVTEATETTEPSTEATVPESEPEPTQAPTKKPEPKPTQPKPTEPEDTRPRPTQEPHETEPGETQQEETQPQETEPERPQKSYTGKEEVAAYIAKYGRLPDNFITKSQAKSYGWKSGRRLEDYAPGMCIGGDRFYNKEGLLPSGTYYECDIDTLGVKNRGAKRIVFSKNGDIYYTSDHYASFYRYLGPNQWEKV